MTFGTDTLLGDMPLERGSQHWQVQVAWFRQIEIIDSMQFVLRRVRARVGGTPRRSTVNVSARPSRRLPAAPGWVCSNSLASASSWASAMIAVGAW